MDPVLRSALPKYTGTETCVKCGAPATDIGPGYDLVQDTIALQCKRCANKWEMRPRDDPQP